MPIQITNKVNPKDVLKGGFIQSVFDWIGTAYLGIAVTSTSEWLRVQDFAWLVGSIVSDASGTAYFEFSSDEGTTVTYVAEVAVTGGVATADSGIEVECIPGHVRIRYVNGAVAQTSFLLSFSPRSSQ